MKICVIGQTTAKSLSKRGHEVFLVDAHSQAGQGASEPNGAQLSYSYVAPLADGSGKAIALHMKQATMANSTASA